MRRRSNLNNRRWSIIHITVFGLLVVIDCKCVAEMRRKLRVCVVRCGRGGGGAHFRHSHLKCIFCMRSVRVWTRQTCCTLIEFPNLVSAKGVYDSNFCCFVCLIQCACLTAYVEFKILRISRQIFFLLQGLIVGKPEGRRPLERPRHRWEDNIKMKVEVGLWGMDWIGLA